MIKKDTNIIFIDEPSRKTELVGGIPLSKGYVITFNEDGKKTDYFVFDKKVELLFNGKEQNAKITYFLKKKH